MSSSFKSPVDTAKAISATAGAKNSANIVNVILLSFLAGAYIAFGGLLAEIASAGMLAAGAPVGLEKFVFGAVFPVGLIIVVLAGSELFTGNVMFMTIGVLDGSASVGGLAKNWVLSWLFNFVGALFVAFVLAYMGGLFPADSAFATKATAVAAAKVKMPFAQAFIKAIGCNWLVCLAVWLANASDDIIGKIVGIWFPIMAFVTIGFEHSVANMFFIPLGLFLGAEGVTWSTMIINNLVPVTLGNIVGGAVFVACIYWYTYLKD
ncbi:MAG: formate/nitrite transporter family protein [Methanobrevibacter sp.]|jgi:formate/nitrite transporter|uniref:Probable formate transporter n=1 Tax=Methanobrevibacter millerae TaxID=230361 RepID=A0A8T3VLV4_9EURY|nr:formate/nitrite transporter family protein [Methanobrevibacter millerae]MBE6505731.1 formate/nitrite transporter family protein [Methanobrevibacter millerae]MBQ6345774.1 formate/nitrite transporter family protein [Methanobrevibacter sp.]MBR0370760.1 formate/nitrite transporter family protein [Methanobrevibacter sp.]